MLVALGLGNPDRPYAGTRHNVGKEVVASLAARLRLRVLAGKGEYTFARDPSRDLVLVVPTTYMNLSGRAAVAALDQFGAGTGDLLVVCDDFSLPLGTLRLRPQGSDGGHNGLASVICDLASDAFGRLRIGIGPVPEGRDPVDFVLGAFSAAEAEVMAKAKATAAEAVLAVAASGMERAMNVYNKRAEPPQEGTQGGQAPQGEGTQWR